MPGPFTVAFGLSAPDSSTCTPVVVRRSSHDRCGVTTLTVRLPAGVTSSANSSGQFVVPYCTKAISSSSMPSSQIGGDRRERLAVRQLRIDPVDDGLLGHPPDPKPTLVGAVPGVRLLLRSASGELAGQGGVGPVEQLQPGSSVKPSGGHGSGALPTRMHSVLSR